MWPEGLWAIKAKKKKCWREFQRQRSLPRRWCVHSHPRVHSLCLVKSVSVAQLSESMMKVSKFGLSSDTSASTKSSMVGCLCSIPVTHTQKEQAASGKSSDEALGWTRFPPSPRGKFNFGFSGHVKMSFISKYKKTKSNSFNRHCNNLNQRTLHFIAIIYKNTTRRTFSHLPGGLEDEPRASQVTLTDFRWG